MVETGSHAISVADLERSFAFYSQVFGVREYRDDSQLRTLAGTAGRIVWQMTVPHGFAMNIAGDVT